MQRRSGPQTGSQQRLGRVRRRRLRLNIRLPATVIPGVCLDAIAQYRSVCEPLPRLLMSTPTRNRGDQRHPVPRPDAGRLHLADAGGFDPGRRLHARWRSSASDMAARLALSGGRPRLLMRDMVGRAVLSPPERSSASHHQERFAPAGHRHPTRTLGRPVIWCWPLVPEAQRELGPSCARGCWPRVLRAS